MSDSAAGMGAYQRRLKWILEEDPGKSEETFQRLCSGWYVGTKDGKARLAGKLQSGEARGNAAIQKELEEVRWNRLLKEGMTLLGKTHGDCETDLKSADWKVALGAWLKSISGVPNRWLADALHMGNFQTASKHMSNYQKTGNKQCPYARELAKVSKYKD